MSIYLPDRGDVVWLDFDPAAGHEQAKTRPALVLTPQQFSRLTGLTVVAPITSRVRGNALEVHLETGKTNGVVICHHVKSIDFRARRIRFIEKAPESVTEEALSKVKVLFD
ncbi:type II toxin-antitoxin system PemK/MazF family toxin [Enterobacteriaceae bacterium H20N1]|uniref:Type II toxin-antitoxin system PemK/MazF family toxin n=1 Tax=Dryocola boscaweniae TaxID=2925397 RepID=A0A9X2W9X7_9ENTR|nr:type II toxin-antitoxin system PemK/MazF family toxin [Dryocola boscaweniae]MCT4703231.1 type II toxin-antitoxin system PemK/MazF family toxin [Dryocola boscaweniae]MCT4720399.1 type II toxin-antitoxin system PemK/MazF family toxin [Dryocola boscaweniae]